jgi:toxin HigB-1
LIFAFDTKSLRTICENESQAKLKVGVRVAKLLKHRLADLRAATSVKDLVAGQPHVVEGTDGYNMALELCDGFRIFFTANHTQNPITKSGNLDWTKVSRIKILRIDNDHD